MARQRTPAETAQRREAQRTERAARSSGRLAPPGSHFVTKLRNQFALATKHPGSKRGASHRPDASADNRLARAATWSQVTGRPLPPQARIRTDRVSGAVPMLGSMRRARYIMPGLPAQQRAELTPAQRKRARRKIGRQLAGLKIGSAEHEQLGTEYLALRPDGSAD